MARKGRNEHSYRNAPRVAIRQSVSYDIISKLVSIYGGSRYAAAVVVAWRLQTEPATLPVTGWPPPRLPTAPAQ